jgi:hypothetical protein
MSTMTRIHKNRSYSSLQTTKTTMMHSPTKQGLMVMRRGKGKCKKTLFCCANRVISHGCHDSVLHCSGMMSQYAQKLSRRLLHAFIPGESSTCAVHSTMYTCRSSTHLQSIKHKYTVLVCVLLAVKNTALHGLI